MSLPIFNSEKTIKPLEQIKNVAFFCHCQLCNIAVLKRQTFLLGIFVTLSQRIAALTLSQTSPGFYVSAVQGF